ncbi:hypothetical protein OsJ_01643 [Oryza sativa Japonica Group]|uniref:Uncharacterized protein n=1 Tax=Oryza sativa subsp. japonica TaxID=39947 RepID=B9EWA0_ORYSJ|nr:hypothetical protein OsJ_01643 [Oryza sativa Japonica Group]
MLNLLLLLVLATTSWSPAASGQDTSSATVSPLNTHCNATAGNHTAVGSAYLSNLRALGGALSRRALATGFASGSYGAAPRRGARPGALPGRLHRRQLHRRASRRRSATPRRSSARAPRTPPSTTTST